MKKLYIFAIVAFAFALNTNAQVVFDDDFELYGVGPMGNQNPSVWTNWSGVTGTAEDIQVSQTFAASGIQSGNVPPGGVTDAILLMGNRDAGFWVVRFNVYVPGGATGYWNFQQEETPGVQWNGQWFVDATGSGGTAGNITYDLTGTDIPYPNDQWFEILYEIDLDFLEISMWVDGALFLDAEPYAGTWIGAMDFFSIDANNDYYLDDVLFNQGPLLAVDDFSADVFSVYPNPVRDVLNISTKTAVDSVIVYDVLGKIVLQAQPDAISPTINMSALSSGAYLVQVTIGNASKTIKVIK